MPYCNGGSLADLLRRQGALAEREAKSIIVQVPHGLRLIYLPISPHISPYLVQVLHGLRHLHRQREPIIHYDLKPANILLHEGEVLPPQISPFLPIPPHTSPYLPIPPHTSPYLPISPHRCASPTLASPR